MLDYLFGLLDRVFNAQVTGTKPLQVHPALSQLLGDVRAGKVDVIVVYKVDRLTRALSDFTRIVDVLDATGA